MTLADCHCEVCAAIRAHEHIEHAIARTVVALFRLPPPPEPAPYDWAVEGL